MCVRTMKPNLVVEVPFLAPDGHAAAGEPARTPEKAGENSLFYRTSAGIVRGP